MNEYGQPGEPVLRIGDRMRMSVEFHDKLKEDEYSLNMIVVEVLEIRIERDGLKTIVMGRLDS